MDAERNLSEKKRISCVCAKRETPGRRLRTRIRKAASGCIFWTGMALIGLAAIPAGIFFGIICIAVRGTDLAIKLLEQI